MLRLNKDGFPGNPLGDQRAYRKHAAGSGSRAPHAVKLERRDAACARILVLLQSGPKSARALADEIGLIPSTAYAYLRYMAIDLRSVHRTGMLDQLKRETWALGEDLLLPTRDQMMDTAFAQRQRTVPAKQVGMWRDGLVSALFGAPATT